VFVSGFPNKSSPPSSPPTVPAVIFESALPLTTKEPTTLSVVPSNVKLASAFAVFAVPREVRILLSAGFVIVLKPVPDVPELPLVPDDPDDPELPEDPDVPALPDEPLVPLDPLVPVDPLDPELPDVPVEPDVPEDPELPDVPLVAAVKDVPFIIKDPVIFTEPVNWCVLDNCDPNTVDPVTYSCEEVIF